MTAQIDPDVQQLRLPASIAEQLQLKLSRVSKFIHHDDGTEEVFPFAAPVRIEINGFICVTEASIRGDMVVLGTRQVAEFGLTVDPDRNLVEVHPTDKIKEITARYIWRNVEDM